MDGWVFAENFAPVPPLSPAGPGYFPLGTFAQVVRLPPKPLPAKKKDENATEEDNKPTVAIPQNPRQPGISLASPRVIVGPAVPSPRGLPHYPLPYELYEDPTLTEEYFHRKSYGVIHHRGKKRDGRRKVYMGYLAQSNVSGRQRAANRSGMAYDFPRGNDVTERYPAPRNHFW